MATGVGEAFTRPAAIPQGCPYSMLFMALLTAPWSALLAGMPVEARAIADDILVATGLGMWRNCGRSMRKRWLSLR
eukprot:2022037-Alexandrium_andersonii.AAC.1